MEVLENTYRYIKIIELLDLESNLLNMFVCSYKVLCLLFNFGKAHKYCNILEEIQSIIATVLLYTGIYKPQESKERLEQS